MDAPRIQKEPGIYPPGTLISIAASAPNAEIYYTLDGSPPSARSKRYRHPIPLGPDTTATETMRLRAVAVGPDGRKSPVSAANFERAVGVSMRFRKPDTWSTAFVHYWGTEPDGLSTRWPGRPMSSVGNGWYQFELSGQASANLVFNDAGGAQSRDLVIATPDAWFDGDERWDFDPSRFKRCLFPGGVAKALVVSMDDGPAQDRRVVDILNRCGIRGTFHLNSGRLGQPGYIGAEDAPTLYLGHEISTHSVSHPYLDALSRAEIIAEVGDDLAAFSRLSGGDVRGHAYPFGACNATVIDVLRQLGIAYARTATSTGGFRLPSDLLSWNPTCHHTAASELADAFLARSDRDLALFFIFGHSWELDAGEPTNSWAYMESLAQWLGGRDDIWYTTAIELADYVRAMRSIQFSLVDDTMHNPTGIDLWLRRGQSFVLLPAGQSITDMPWL